MRCYKFKSYFNYIKCEFIDAIASYVSPATLSYIKKRINSIKFCVVDEQEFSNLFYKYNFNYSFISASFEYNGTIYLNINYLSKHLVYHELLHALSESRSKYYIKSGFFMYSIKHKAYYGKGINEAFTEYITTMLLKDSYSGYPLDFYYMILLFIKISGIKIIDLLDVYFTKEDWLSETIVDNFSNNNSLIYLIVQYDNSLLCDKSRFNKHEVLKMFKEAIIEKRDKISDNEYKELVMLYNNLYNYYNINNKVRSLVNNDKVS